MTTTHQRILDAVRQFAPHLEHYPDVKVIHLFSTNDSLRKEIRALCGGKTICVEHVVGSRFERQGINEVRYETPVLPLPPEADLVITKANPTVKVEWLAARIARSQVAVLPEAGNYLMALLDKRRILTLVGAEQAQ